MSPAFSASIAHLCHCLPSKRKLDDYASLPSSPLTSTMRSSKPSRSSSSSSSSTIHFFARADSKTLVLHSHPSSTVNSVIDQIRFLTGIPISFSDHRLIYSGRQLDLDSTLADSRIVIDACLHLTARLRSTRFPHAWRLVYDLEKSVNCLLLCKSIPREIYNIEYVITQFLILAPTGQKGEIEDSTLEYLEVFVTGSGAALLIRLYLSNMPSCKVIAERAVRLFLNPVPEYFQKSVQVQCWVIVLEFCKLIAGMVGKNDSFYVSCRSTLGSLMGAQVEVIGLKGRDLVSELFPFVEELAELVVKGLSSEVMVVQADKLGDFWSFLVAMRRAVRDWMGGDEGQIPKSLFCIDAHLKYKRWLYALHAIFLELLGKVDECLKKVEALAEKGSMHGGPRWAL